MNERNILNHWNSFKFSKKVAVFSFWSKENGFSFWQSEKLSEMLSTIRKRLQSILACIFALRIFDKGEKWPLYQRSAGRRKKNQENPRKWSMFGNLHLERFWWTLIHPWRALQQENYFDCVSMFLSQYFWRKESSVFVEKGTLLSICGKRNTFHSQCFSVFLEAGGWNVRIFCRKDLGRLFELDSSSGRILVDSSSSFNHHALQVCQAQPPHSVGDVQEKAQWGNQMSQDAAAFSVSLRWNRRICSRKECTARRKIFNCILKTTCSLCSWCKDCKRPAS